MSLDLRPISLPLGVAHQQRVRYRRWPATARAVRIAALTTTGVLLLWAILQLVVIYQGALSRHEVGWDAYVYASIGTHFLETGQAYFPAQSQAYEAAGMVNIYPPTALYLFVPASLLPRVLWWLVPLALIGWSLYRLRPAWWALPIMVLACVVPLNGPSVPVALVYGNTLLWTISALFVAAAFRPGAAWMAMIKPTEFLFALPLALRSWRGMTVAIAMAALMLPLWFDWLAAMRNLEGFSPFRGIAAWPALMIPLIAYLARKAKSSALEEAALGGGRVTDLERGEAAPGAVFT